ncbi:MAG: SpoIID/LytB domain-containing protein [Solirubrobacteraceae bacterium]
MATASAGAAAKVTTTTTTRTTAAPAVSRFYISGAGYGHGVGMSQYGAAGFALHGYSYEQILSHYYSGTALAKTNPDQPVTVLLRMGTAVFRGASHIQGQPHKHLNPRLTYSVIPEDEKLALATAGRTVGVFQAPVSVRDTDGQPLTLADQGSYDGALVFRPDGQGGVMTVNAVPLDAYVRGVVTTEMPSDWPLQALEAQAVAARTYALTAPPVSPDFELYNNTRSQMYRGVSAQTPDGNTAVADTSGEIVTYDGHPAITYFFASSGGHTESIQNVWRGFPADPWLRGVADPYDNSFGNPYYRWVDSFTLAAAQRVLDGLYQGSLEGVQVTRTGASPRVVRALVVGTRGARSVSGTQLQQLFGTRSTYMTFTTLRAQGEQVRTTTTRRVDAGPVSPKPPALPTTTSTTTSADPASTTVTATTSPATLTAPAATASRFNERPSGAARVAKRVTVSFALRGSVYPAARGLTVTAQQDSHGTWRSVARAPLSSHDSYTIAVKAAGTYRVLYQGLDGPDIQIR